MFISDTFGYIVIAVVAFVIYKAWDARKNESTEVRTINQLPPSIQSIVNVMDLNSQNAFFLEYSKRRKKLWLSYVFFIFSLHYLYNRKVGLQFAYWFTFGGMLIWFIADVFRMPSIVANTNGTIAREIVQTLSLGSSFKK